MLLESSTIENDSIRNILYVQKCKCAISLFLSLSSSLYTICSSTGGLKSVYWSFATLLKRKKAKVLYITIQILFLFLTFIGFWDHIGITRKNYGWLFLDIFYIFLLFSLFTTLNWNC